MDHPSRASEGQIPIPPAVIHSNSVDISQPIPLSNLKDKTILITGGSSGFGAACAKRWAAHGANIIIGDLNVSQGTQLVASLRESSSNDNHHFLQLDVTNWSSQAAFFREAARLSAHGGIDHCMASAGIADAEEQGLFEEPPDYSHQENPPAPKLKTHEVNLTGVLYTTHLALSYLSRNPGSDKCSLSGQHSRDRHLLLVASIAGLAGLAGQPLYAGSKHGVVGLFRTLRLTAPLKTGVRVNMINPCGCLLTTPGSVVTHLLN
jgi:NAD(P)-dependent dehydrogenase (short-subunit alcohol dehydrogenase family)